MILGNNQKYVVKVNGSVVSTHSSSEEANFNLMQLKQTNPGLYENAIIAIVDNNNKELLLG